MSLTSPAPIDAANEQALQRIYAARPYLVAIRPARELLSPLACFVQALEAFAEAYL